MYKEREEIIRLLIPFLMQTVNNNYTFDIPDSCLALKEQYKEDNDPVRQFFAECCQFRSGKFKVIRDNDYTRREIYSTYKYWYKENVKEYSACISERKFRDSIVDILAEGGIEEKDAVFNTTTGRYYAITLNNTGKMYYNELIILKNHTKI